MSKSTMKIMLVFTTICQFCLCVQTSFSGTHKDSITQSKNTPDFLTHKQVSQPINEDLFDLIKFYQEAIPIVNLDEAIPKVLEELSKKGYVLKPVTHNNIIHAGTREYNIGVHTKAYRFASPDGKFWLDVIRFRDENSSKKCFLEIKKHKNLYCGSETPYGWTYHTWNELENSDVGVIFFKSDWLINIGITLPVTVPTELIIGGKESKLSQADHQRILQSLKNEIDSLNHIIRLVVHHFVSDEDSAIIPSPVFSAPEFLTAEQISAKVTVSKSCSFDTAMELALAEGESIKFDVEDNTHGLKELIMYRSGSIIHMLFFDNNGTLLSRGGSDFNRVEGALRQVGWLPYLIIATWDVKEDKVIIKFRISSDKDSNQREYEKFKARKTKMSLQIKNRSKVLPPVQLTETERLTGFVNLWSEVKYNFVFFDQVPDLDWDAVLTEYLPKVQLAKSTADYYDLLKECIARLHDGHTSVWGPSNEPTCNLPFEVRSYQGKALIVKIFSKEKIKDQELRSQFLEANLQAGEELTHIDGRSVQEMLTQDIYPFIFASTSQARDFKAYPLILRGNLRSDAKIRLRSLDGTVREVTLTRANYPFRESWPSFECRDLGNGIFYVNLPSFGSKDIVNQFDEIFPQIRDAKGLILDVRRNGGGSSSNGYAIVSYLIGNAIESSKWKTRKYMPAFRAWGKKEEWYEGSHGMIEPKSDDQFLGPVVVLTSVETNSAAEDFVVALHASKRATVVGGKTRGSTGQPLNIDLPGGGGARICTKRDTYPDGREFVGVGIIPDVEVNPTVADIISGRDVVLEKAIEILKSK